MTSVTIAGRHRTWTVSPSSSTVTNGSRESIEGSPARWKGMHQSDDSSQSEDEGEDSIYLSRGSSAATETADENPLAVSPLSGPKHLVAVKLASHVPARMRFGDALAKLPWGRPC